MVIQFKTKRKAGAPPPPRPPQPPYNPTALVQKIHWIAKRQPLLLVTFEGVVDRFIERIQAGCKVGI